MGRRPRRGFAASAAAILLLALAAPLSASAAGGDEEEEAPPSSTIAIPYEGEAELPAAEGWTLLCDPPIELPEGVTVTCTAEGVTFVAPEYLPDWGTHEIVVRQVSGSRVLDAGYRVTMAPPAPPVVLPTVWRSPADAGGTLLVPFSELGLSCTACGDAEVQIVAVSPLEGVRVGTNGSHLVVRPNADFRGMVVITFGVADQFDQIVPVQLGVWVRPAPATAAGGLHVSLTAPATQPLELDATTLVWAADETELAGARVIACGPALRGTVACDGLAILYTPPAEEPVDPAAPAPDPDAAPPAPVVDQFAVRVVTADGRELDASVTVTLSPEATEPSPFFLLPASLDIVAPLAVSPTIPVEDGEGGAGGLLAPLSRTLDGLSAIIPTGGSR